MTRKFVTGAASIAIATSFASAAHAQQVQGDVLELNAESTSVELASNSAEVVAIEIDGNVQVSAEVVAAASPTNVSIVTPQAVNPNYGNIGAFYGNIGAFYGNIDAFYGDISPFWDDINPFYGNISPFWGDISPFYGDISPFWGDIDAFWGDIDAFNGGNLESLGQFWQSSSNQIVATEETWSSLNYSIDNSGAVTIVFDGAPNRIRNSIEVLISQAEAQFGAAYQAATGKTFREGFVAEILARHGLDLADNSVSKRSLAKSEAERAAFYLDWHDSLNEYSGIDAIDHWMGAINWTPSITQIQGEGKQAVIGIIDGSFSGDADLSNNIAWSGGGTSTVGGHGAGVASLIAGAHDGEGVMGIAPQVQIATYNPFDDNHATSWDEVANGIDALLYQYVGGNETGYVSVINLSLGESGWALSQGLADTFALPHLARWRHETLYVVAAGNDGVTQTQDIDWNHALNTSFILVGSIDPNGNISDFSNRPGSACLLDNGVCSAGNELYRRTVVAPGSLILVSDGQGGTTRASGTSFAAPLVSGAVTLLHDRWPWLARNPEESAEIIFRSAHDLGAPGPDPVYGWGLLDVAASQSPLDFGNLDMTVYLNIAGGTVATKYSAAQFLASGIPATWETQNAVLTAFEDIGGTYRDFAIPLSASAYGTSSNVLGHGNQRLQDFIGHRFANWLLSGGADKDGDGKVGISQIRSNDAETKGQWAMRYEAIQPRFTQDGAVRPVHQSATLTDPSGSMSFTLGHGQGALSLSGNSYGMISDHDYALGGVNPVLGFASGEFFAGASFQPTKATTVTVGYTNNREDWEDLEGVSELERNLQRQLGAREAEALTIDVEQRVSNNFSVKAQYTHLREQDAVLGAQTSVEAFLGEGSSTDAVTLSATMELGNGLSFDLSATGGMTETADGQVFANSGQVLSTAGQFSINKRGIANSRDILRLSVGQPLTVEQGELEFLSDQVIDRETGEIGAVSQTIGIETKRRYTGEIVYATPVTETSEFGVIGRFVSAGGPGEQEDFIIGANFGLRF